MRALLAVVCLVALASRASDAASRPQVDGHGDGYTTVPVTLHVVDPDGAAVTRALVTFFDGREAGWIDQLEGMAKLGHPSDQPRPSGTAASAAEDGSVTIQCRFFAAFLYSWASGEKRDVGTDIFPDGRFVVSAERFITKQIDARELFPTVPYRPDQFPATVTIKIERQPNKPVQINSVDAPRKMGAVIAMSRSPRSA